jgi:tetratricopeptide (TPR) repeat protein
VGHAEVCRSLRPRRRAGLGLAARGNGTQLGGPPAALETSYATEHAWATGEIAADIVEMANAAGQGPTPAGAPRVAAPWDLPAFTEFARAHLGRAGSPAAAGPAGDVHPELTAGTVLALLSAGDAVSAALKGSMRDPRAHEAAALVLAAFGLAEASDDFTDVRWVLNRMTAHLAMAGAIGGTETPGVDGRLAAIALDVLSNRQTRALQALAAFDLNGTDARARWARVLTMRVTQDWRMLKSPASASRLEKREYFRARRAAMSRRLATEDLADIEEAIAPDLTAIVESHVWGVEDGHGIVAPSVERELTEARGTYQRIHGRPMPSLPQAMNQRASRLMTPQGPRVLPWGAWAELHQRRLAMHIQEIDNLLRHMIESRSAAEAEKTRLDVELEELWLFPLGATARTAGPNGKEADLSRIADAVGLASRAPELIAHPTWVYLETGSKYEMVAKAMPRAATWFAAPSPAVPFEAGLRLAGAGHRQTGAALDALLAEAPHDLRLVRESLGERRAGDPPPSRARPALRARIGYDMRAMDLMVHSASGPQERAEAQRPMCALSARECSGLAATLAEMGDEADAAANYEKAFADPALDSVVRANQAGWLVNYYFRQKRTREALRLADEIASTGAWRGMVVAAYLYERLGKTDEADALYRRVTERYKDPAQMLGFYYRESVVRKNPAFESRWRIALAGSFPGGLQDAPAALPPQPPASGVFVYKDSAASRKGGLRAGDIIVGLEGWRVDTQEQYAAINAFFENETLKLTVWRGKVFELEIPAPGRLLGTELRTHPVKGWIE